MTLHSNPAPTPLPILHVIKERWSPVAFSDQALSEDKIAMLFEAARWAPSSFNEQPWRYLYASKEDKEGREKLESLLMPGNGWAKNAGLLILSFAKKTFSKNGKENVHCMHDLGCATGYLVLQATELGLVSHQMAGFDREKSHAVLGVPEDNMPGSMIAIGEPGDRAALTEELREREAAPRVRRDRKEFAFRGQWNEQK